MNASSIEVIATVLFFVAILHTFVVSKFAEWSHHYPENSTQRVFLHYLAEVEAVFGLWALVLFVIMTIMLGFEQGALPYLEGLNFTEPAFVFVIMCMAGTKPVIKMAEKIILIVAKSLPFPRKISFYVAALVIGPILGSFITEPAAMTVTALILRRSFYSKGMSERFKYATIGLLFVNISIGGTLTHFAAPPVLMVAGKWGWDMAFMMTHFGYKSVLAILVSTVGTAAFFRKELQGDLHKNEGGDYLHTPAWVYLVHLLFLALVVYSAHHMVFFLGLFLFFLAFVKMTNKYQDPVKISSSLLVGFFLAGLVFLGSLQKWWLQPLITGLGDQALYFGATALTAITDNAALTYLGSLVEGLSESSKYYLVAGAVTGGGLTVIANAPNPAGYGILKDSFAREEIAPLKLLLAALGPTIVTMVVFELLPSF